MKKNKKVKLDLEILELESKIAPTAFDVSCPCEILQIGMGTGVGYATGAEC